MRRGALSDHAAWETEYGTSRDISALGVERNVFRYRPAEVTVRLAEGGDLTELVRVLAAGVRARARCTSARRCPCRAGCSRWRPRRT